MIFPFILNVISISVLLFELDEHERGMCNNNNGELTMVESKSPTVIAPMIPRIPIFRDIVTVEEHGNIIGKLQLLAM